MKKWEEIIKDKMEGYDSPLPEGSLAEFRALRNGAAVKPAARRFPLVWVLAPALAAGLAAVLLLRQPSVQENGIQVVSQPAAPVVAASMPATPKPAVQRAVANNEVVQEDIVTIALTIDVNLVTGQEGSQLDIGTVLTDGQANLLRTHEDLGGLILLTYMDLRD